MPTPATPPPVMVPPAMLGLLAAIDPRAVGHAHHHLVPANTLLGKMTDVTATATTTAAIVTVIGNASDHAAPTMARVTAR